eukprot:PhF_6_TR8318/c0_g1_i1/m.12923/K18468/VPS35; vacuolar protein sorting-associated protein 35
MAQNVAIEQPTLTPEQEQEKWLGEACVKVRERAQFLHKAMANKDLGEVLKWASAILAEMRTSLLSPQNYYELYIKVFDELQQLEAFFYEEVTVRGRKAEDLYEVVQHAGNVVPRMYLLITIGSVYIKTKQAPAKEILRDLVEMCKGVQHPTRGLFLRNYLSTVAKNKLPDEYEEGNEYAGEGGSVEDSVAFILQNFREMTWLWVRMETKSVVANKTKRDKERRELRILVGFNLVRLSQLDGVTKKYYKTVVLPRVLDIVLAYKDPIAQQYLMECIIQVFPDEYHLATLDHLLSCAMNLMPGVDVHPILTSLMDRLGNFVLQARENPEHKLRESESAVISEMFDTFRQRIYEAFTSRPKLMTQAAFAETQNSLLGMCVKAYPGDFGKVDEVLGSAAAFFQKNPPEPDAVKVIRKILERCIDTFKNINIVLDLTNYGPVLSCLGFKPRREVALSIAQGAIRFNQYIETTERAQRLFELIATLVYDVEDRPAEASAVYTMSPEEEFEEEQHTICRLLQLLNSTTDLGATHKMLSIARKELGKGGDVRMKYTLVPVVYLYIKLAIRLKKQELAGVDTGIKIDKLFHYLHSGGGGKGVLEVLAKDSPQLSMQLYLNAASAADTCGLDEVAYEMLTEAFTLYEERISDTKVQIRLLNVMTSTLCMLRNLSVEHYDIVSTKVCQYSSKLMKKPDQCRAATQCSHLFVNRILTDDHRAKILECLQRALKIVDNCIALQQIPLFVEILNHYVYYFQTGTRGVGAKYLNTLIDLINTNIKQATEEEGTKEETCYAPVTAYYNNTKKYIKAKQTEGSEEDVERWREVILNRSS